MFYGGMENVCFWREKLYDNKINKEVKLVLDMVRLDFFFFCLERFIFKFKVL